MSSNIQNKSRSAFDVFLGGLKKFSFNESGATTSDFVIVAAVAAAMAAGAVTTTRSGANVSSENTVAALDAQAPMFDKLSEGQQNTADGFQENEYHSSNNNAGASGPEASEPYDYSQDAGSESEDDTSDDGDETASVGGGDETVSEGDGESSQSSGDEADGQNASDQTQNSQTGGLPDNNSADQGTGADSNENTSDSTPDEEVVAEAQPEPNPGCENPYNKRGNIRKKCR